MAKKNVFSKANSKLEKQKKPITKWALFLCFVLFSIVASGEVRLLKDQNENHFVKLPSFLKVTNQEKIVFWESSWTYLPNLMSVSTNQLKPLDSLNMQHTNYSMRHKNAWIRLLSLQSDSNYLEIRLADSMLFSLEASRCKLSPSACLDTLNQVSQKMDEDSLLNFRPDSLFNFPEHILLTSVQPTDLIKPEQIKNAPLYFALEKELKQVRQLKNPLN